MAFSIAPDYILCSKKVEKSFLDVARKVMEEWYGENLQQNPDIPRIVNEKHFNRLKGLIESTKGSLVFGGKCDAQDLWIEPTIVGMQSEIFRNYGNCLIDTNILSIECS